MMDQEPQGLDQFIGSLQSQSQGPEPASVSSPMDEPSGVDNFVDQIKQQQYGSGTQQAIAGAEGVLQGVGGFLAPAAERLLGVDPEDIRGRAEANPWTHGLGEAAGFIGGAFTGTGEAALLGKIGEAAEFGNAATTGQRLVDGATRMGAEMAAYGANNELTKAIVQDPNQTIGSAITNVGLNAVLGAATGPLFTGAGMLGKAAIEKSGLGNVLTEFKDRMAYRGANLNPNEQMQNELGANVNAFRNVGDDTGGFTGLKAAGLEKTLPQELTPAIRDAAQDIAQKSQDAFVKMAKQGVPDNYIQKFQNKVNDFLEVVTNPESSVNDHFDAMNGLKKNLADFSKGNWGPFAVPSYKPEFDFLQVTKNLGHDIKNTLENPEVWGQDAANLQKSLNGAWSKASPFVDQVETKFMDPVGNDRVVSPQKFTTYTNQTGKSTSLTTKQQLMGKFVDAMGDFHDAVANAYEKAGIAAPERPGMGALKDSLQRQSIGSRLADAWYDKLAGRAIGTTIGAGAGGALGHLSMIPGAGYAGTVIGGKLGESVLPSFIQPLLEKAVSSQSFHEAMSFGQNVLKGESLLNKGAKNLFQGGDLLPKYLFPDKEKIDNLNEKVKDLSVNQQKMFGVSANLGHYMPAHAEALSQTTMNAVNTLNAQRPNNVKQAPLDKEAPVSKDQKAKYNRTLAIAQQPLIALQHIKDSTLLPQDVMTIKSLYPNLYNHMSQQIVNAMTEHLSKDGSVPYPMRQSLSLFLGQAMDSSLFPQNIQAAQGAFIASSQTPQGQSASASEPKNPSKLGKVASNYRTPEQAALSAQITKA